MQLFWNILDTLYDHFFPPVKRFLLKQFDRYMPWLQRLATAYLIVLTLATFVYYIWTGEGVFGLMTLTLVGLGTITGGIVLITRPDY